MSAVASAEFVSAPPALEAVAGPSAAQLAEQEMYRWMFWFGLPSLVAALFVGAVFATGTIWYIGGAIAGIIGAVGVLIWLAMTSCTNEN
jgi:hypothetical protein